MTLDEFSNALRLLMNDSVDLPAEDVLQEIERVMNVLRREARFEAKAAPKASAHGK